MDAERFARYWLWMAILRAKRNALKKKNLPFSRIFWCRWFALCDRRDANCCKIVKLLKLNVMFACVGGSVSVSVCLQCIPENIETNNCHGALFLISVSTISTRTRRARCTEIYVSPLTFVLCDAILFLCFILRVWPIAKNVGVFGAWPQTRTLWAWVIAQANGN